MGFQQVHDLADFLVDGQTAIHHGFHLGSHFLHHGWFRKRLGTGFFTYTCTDGGPWLVAVLLGCAISFICENSSTIQKHQPKGVVNGNCGLIMVLPALMIVITMACVAFCDFYSWCFLGRTILCGLVTSAGLGKGNLAASSQTANDFPQRFWLHGNKQIPLGWSLATNQTWNLSGTQ